MKGFELIQTVGITGMELAVTSYTSFEFQDSKFIAIQILKKFIDTSKSEEEVKKYQRLLDEVRLKKLKGDC